MTWHSAQSIVGHLKGRWMGRSGTCRCPSHDDRTPSMSVSSTRDGRVLVHCHSGCDQLSVIGELKRMGLWPDGEPVVDPSYPYRLTTPADRDIAHKDERERRQAAQDIWDRGNPLAGTHGEAYLRARGIRLPPSAQLRYLPNLKYGPTTSFPALLARIADDRGLCAIQRTWLHPREPRKADLSPAKKTLGPMGEGAVRLRMPSGDVLGIAEGVETSLSASQLYSVPVWSVCGVQRLTKISIPETVRIIHIFGDPGEVGKREAFAAADHWERKGYGCDVYFPAAHFCVSDDDDFNAVITKGALRAA